MLIDKIACIGVGQCGSNFVRELENLQFNAFYVNTSLEDLDTIETDVKNKYHINGTKGMGKDRAKATECILSNNNADNIGFAIHEKYAMSNILYFFYSLSGGTGGTMGNFIAENMMDILPDKIINVVAILPKNNEDIGQQANAIESLKHLERLQKEGIINQLHLLDNNSREDIFSINKDFATCFDRFVSFDEIDKEGNLDEYEREQILNHQGMAVILEFSNDDFGNGISDACDQSMYAKWFKDPKLHGLILNKKQNKEVNRQLVKEALGSATFTHASTWNDDSNVLVSVGMSFNDNILIKMKKEAQELLEKRKKIELESKKDMLEDVEFDSSAIMKEVNNKKTPSTSSSRVSAPRRRGEKRASSVLDKYRNM